MEIERENVQHESPAAVFFQICALWVLMPFCPHGQVQATTVSD